DTHYDRHDVFIAQLAGTKKWAVLEPTVKWPLEKQTFPKGEAPNSDPYIECEMSEGDVLYIPRGHWHYAVAVTPSIHFTVGPQSRSGIDFLLWLTNQLMNNEEFLRKDFPVACIKELGGSQSDKDFHRHVENFRQHMIESFEDEDLKEAILQFCMTSNPLRRTYQFPDMALLEEEITPQTEFEMASEQKAVVRYDERSKHAEILIRGHILKLDKISPCVLASLFDRKGTMTGAELVGASGSDDWEPIKHFLLLMYDRGVIQLANSAMIQPNP
ncbi:MAG: cupin domain-containing protein, partial [Gammaproteobacteria bacterium]|nr:cupin domain-containing protein [Gammaproteobacteria bacterium]